jgi:AraC family L-rhamnose operon regulatory protein RhaS
MIYMKEIISYGHIENKLMHPHRNPGMEIVLVDQGNLEWAVDNHPEVLYAGSVFFTLPWQAHGSLRLCEPKNRIYYILFELSRYCTSSAKSIRFPSSFGFAPAEEKMLSTLFCETRQHAWKASTAVQQIFPNLVNLLNSPTVLNASTARAHLRCLILEIARVIKSSAAPEAAVHPSVTSVRTFLRHLQNRLDESWTLNRMADECGIKRTQFAKICHQLNGYPPYMYLSRIRFEKACELLRETRSPITDITYLCGYSSSQYFAEHFKEITGMSPSNYRRNAPQLTDALTAGWQAPEKRSRADELRRKKALSSINCSPNFP